MRNFEIKNIPAFLLIGIICIACSQSDAQREFEREAQTIPENITEMGINGQPIENGMTDPEDWRISPMYAGLIEIETPAYPNPVDLSTPLRILIENKGIDTINGIEVYTFQFDYSNLMGPFYILDQSQIYQGLITIQIDPSQFSRQAVGDNDIYRILIYDQRQNLITYGDVEIIQ